MDALRVCNAIVPCYLYWNIGEHGSKDGSYPENDNDGSNEVDCVSVDAVGKEPRVSYYDGELREGESQVV